MCGGVNFLAIQVAYFYAVGPDDDVRAFRTCPLAGEVSNRRCRGGRGCRGGSLVTGSQHQQSEKREFFHGYPVRQAFADVQPELFGRFPCIPYMPEGPSIVILKELAAPFKGKKVLEVTGNAKVAKERALGKKVIAFKSWGKHFLICFDDFTVKIHFMLFGSYRINEERDMPPRLSLRFKNGVFNFYACSVKILEEPLDSIYDWSTDVMSDDWDPKAAKKKLKAVPDMLVCDAILDQTIFAGSGNIFKNEVLFRIRVHPKSKIGALPAKKLNELIEEERHYAFDFLKWKKEYTLRQHWLAHTKKTCPRCHIPFKKAHLGTHHRRSFFCNKCQVLYK